MQVFENLCLWKGQLEQIKWDVDWALGCVVKGFKFFGLGQKPKFGPKPFNCKKGFHMRVGPGRLVVRKPIAKAGHAYDGYARLRSGLSDGSWRPESWCRAAQLAGGRGVAALDGSWFFWLIWHGFGYDKGSSPVLFFSSGITEARF